MATSGPDFAREYKLIQSLEFRIAAADTDDKFSAILQRFLAALVLKLTSENTQNRNLVVKVCQYINQRLKISSSISLPVQALLKTFREAHNAFVKRFSLLFIQQGLERQSADQGVELLPDILKSSIPENEQYEPVDRRMWSIAFDFLLDVLRKWRVPDHGSKEDIALKDVFTLSPAQSNKLSNSLSHFLLYDPKAPSSEASLDEDFKAVFGKHHKSRAGVAAPVAKFLFTSIFSDQQRLIPATVLAVDSNPAAANISDVMFKQCNFDLESDETVDALFDLYKTASTKLKIRVLSILSKSQRSTNRTTEILGMVEKQLNNDTTGLEAAKMRAAIFSYLTWSVRVSKSIKDISSRVQEILKEYIELQGWPNMTEKSTGDMELRAKAYESIGLLTVTDQSAPSRLSASQFDLISWLFTSLRCDTARDIRGSIEEALGRVMNKVVISDDDVGRRLKQLLLWNMTAQPDDEDPIYFFPTKNNTKYPALRFANKCLPFSNVDARYIDILALASDRREIVEEGTRGMDTYWHMSNQRVAGNAAEENVVEMPELDTLVLRFFDSGGLASGNESASTGMMLSHAVLFCRNVLVHIALQGTSQALSTEPEWKQRIDALVSNNKEVRQAIKARLTSINGNTLSLLLEAAFRGFSANSAECAETALEFVSLMSNHALGHITEQGVGICTTALPSSKVQPFAARTFGILASLSQSPTQSIETELDQCASWEAAIGQEAVKVRGHLLAAAYALSRSLLRRTEANIGPSQQRLAQLSMDIMASTSDKSLKDSAYLALSQLCICSPTNTTISIEYEIVFKIMLADAKKENEAAVSAVGRLLSFLYADNNKELVEQTLDKVYALHEIKKPEFHFALGEALAVAAAGFRSESTITGFDVDAEMPGWGYHEAFLTTILSKVIEDCKTTKPTLKKAAGIWLLCIVQYCGDEAPVKIKLRDCQAAFGRLLNDRDEIVQETGSRGLSLVFEKGDKALQDDLVRDLVQSFTGTNAKMSGNVSEDTQLFEPGALPTENGQSVSTYKDIVSLATEMGDPSLVYRFMNLASSNAIWTSRAAFGRFGLGSVLADSTYLTENKKFYPKLYRYRFDPNPNVQRSMDEIWKALVKDTNAVLNENFDVIMEDLLKSIVLGKEWRAREASCAAIADLVQGRDIALYEKYLNEIWKVAFKVLDDMKETVRVAAMKLCRTLTSMLIRNLEVGEGTTKRATTMLNQAMPFLLQQMESGGAKEVQQYAIATLLEIVKKSPPRSLQPFAPVILETLVVSLSSLEHESINYLHLNADKYGLTAEKLDKMRVSSVNASPITEAIDKCLESLTVAPSMEAAPEDAMDGIEQMSPVENAMRRLENAFKSAIGLPSKVGLSRVIVTLVVRHPTMFRPYADSFARLNRKNILDRNATISVSFSMSLAYLMRLASDKEVLETSRYAQRLYFESQELSHRSIAGEIVQAISKASNDVFMRFATTFLPFAFIGRNDTNDEVKERFDPTWKDNVGGSRALILYLQETTELISANIKSPLWPIKHACCFAVADLISSMDTSEQYTEKQAKLLWPLVDESLGGKTWEGKEKVITAYPAFVRHSKCLRGDERIAKQMKVIALREAKRTNVAYRPYAIESLGEFARARQDLDLSSDVLPILAKAMEDVLDDSGDAMEIDTGNDAEVRAR